MDAVFALADRISVLVYGRIIATGTVAEVRDDPRGARRLSGRGGRGMSLLLRDRGVEAIYGASQVLFGVDLSIAEGEVVALMGRNGMGKTTTIRSICGCCRAAPAAIEFAGAAISAACRPTASHGSGSGWCPRAGAAFRNLTVRENLVAAARPGQLGSWRSVDRPVPAAGASGAASWPRTLSGGEQQMLAIGRALMTNPRLLILDEATEGLAPLVRQEIWAAIRR